jgi:hemoglobin
VNSSEPNATAFDQIGGQIAVDRIIDSFYDRVDTLPEARIIRVMHPEVPGKIVRSAIPVLLISRPRRLTA